MKYETAGAFRTALEARLNRAARNQSWLVRHRKFIAFDRLIARLLFVAPDRWRLKGAVALDLRYGEQARATRDLDLAHQSGDMDATAALLQAQTSDLGDFFAFELERTAVLDHLVEGAAVRYRVIANLADRRFETFTLDVGLDETFDTPFDLVDGPDHLAFAGIPTLSIPALSLETHVAEKLHAYTQIYPGGMPSSRVKDLVDLALIQSRSGLAADLLRSAITYTFADRDTAGIPSSLPAPPSEWALGYARLTREIGLDPRLEKGFNLVAAFLNPILDGSVANDAVWNPAQGAWLAPINNCEG